MTDCDSTNPDAAPSGLAELGDFYQEVVVHPHGFLAERAPGFLQWQRALRNGWLPDPASVRWPDARYSNALHAGLVELDIARYLPEQAELLDEVLRSLLAAILAGDAVRFQQQDSGADPEAAWLAGAEAAKAALMASWTERVRAWRALEQVFGEGMGPTILAVTGEQGDAWVRRMLAGSDTEDPAASSDNAIVWGRGWDLGQGNDHRVDLREILRLAQRLAGYPKLLELAAALGRERPDATRTAGLEAAVEALGCTRTGVQWVPDPRLPGPPKGLERSDDIARMLPSEAALLTNPTLRLLWHAKRADAGLLSYRRQGEAPREFTETVVESREVQKPSQERIRGPILVCLDTSGSMSGGPEALAKAVLLEVLKIALREKRACVVYGFSGPGQVHETVLEPSGAGLPNLLEMLSHSFGGGTDVAEPLRRATTQLEQAGWRNADLLVLSDGGFGVGQDVLQQLAVAKTTHGLRSFGVLIGRGGNATMAQLCDTLEQADPWVR